MNRCRRVHSRAGLVDPECQTRITFYPRGAKELSREPGRAGLCVHYCRSLRRLGDDGSISVRRLRSTTILLSTFTHSKAPASVSRRLDIATKRAFSTATKPLVTRET